MNKNVPMRVFFSALPDFIQEVYNWCDTYCRDPIDKSPLLFCDGKRNSVSITFTSERDKLLFMLKWN
jgi:hypothetical protein